mgnify:CR=1 FL=1
MKRRTAHHVWFCAAWAALVAQAAPTALCSDCDRACCTATTGGGEPRGSGAGADVGNSCPLCNDHAARLPVENDRQPCTCQLAARQEQPFAPSRTSPTQPRDDAPAVGPAVVPPLVPPALGIGRDYAAGLLDVPIRPVRILFGVWRN